MVPKVLYLRGDLLRRNTPGYVKDLARGMRKDLTPAENILWIELRNRKLNGYKFCRQRPITRYIADFYCHEARLVIELDGSVHLKPEQALYDSERDAYFRSMGLMVLRFPNVAVESNLNSVLEEISLALGEEQGREDRVNPHP